MPSEINITLPTHSFSGKTKHYLNLNQYRNWHYGVSSSIKRNYKKTISDRLNFKFDGQVEIKYRYYAPDKRVRDLMNVVSVVDKFFQDAMVDKGCIIADDTSIVKKITVDYMGIDKADSRIEVTVKAI
tara:strand:+ start:20 stop:403 length:384 start_codon:yes stop_codon:yes gene_type:complete